MQGRGAPEIGRHSMHIGYDAEQTALREELLTPETRCGLHHEHGCGPLLLQWIRQRSGAPVAVEPAGA